MFLGVRDFPKGLVKDYGSPRQLTKQHAAGDHSLDNPVPEKSPFGRSQTLETDRLRQPTATESDILR
jgi:hypothetical protein